MTLKKLFLIIIIFPVITCSCGGEVKESDNNLTSFYVANWNVENLFDEIDDHDKIDEWFLPDSEINWNKEKITLKLNNLRKVILYMNDGIGPDILGIEEVEHKALLESLVSAKSFKKKYQVIQFESPDKRGIDNALIYNSDLFNAKYSGTLRVDLGGEKTTRDILYVVLNNGGNDFHIFVNHWPSRREGLKKSEPNRIKAASVLKNKIDELGTDKNIIILGDFNDLPSNNSISKILNAGDFECEKKVSDAELINLTYKDFQQGKGSYKYRDHWNMLDQIIISKPLLDGQNIDYQCNSFEIIKPDFVLQKKGKYKGTSLPTFGGRKYLKGYSDHFAVGAKFLFIK